MRISFTERKVSISDDLKAYTDKKCQKLDRYFDRDSTATVTYSIERGMHIAEITVQHNGMYFRAQEQTSDMYASIDGAISSLMRQITKNKTRLEKRLRKGAFEREAAELEKTPETVEEEQFEVVRVKPLDVKPMSVDDAILQMNMLNHEFFFFKNSEEKGRHCVIYRRKNGGYGMMLSAD